jgi:DNA-binding response OmpR family regulator
VQILIVEDEQKLARFLKKGLEEAHHRVTLAHDGADGLELARTCPFDVIVLDVMLPGMDGFDVARRLRQSGNRTPILMLTARDAISDVVTGLNVGGDDYLTKPFAFDELIARLMALSRRGPIEKLPQISVADLVLDPATRSVSRAGKPIRLTKTEYILLDLLMRNVGRVLARDTIIETVWGFENEIESNTLDAFLRLLRNKIDGGRRNKLIHTIRGVGYVLREGEV